MNALPSHEYLHECFHLDIENGLLTYKERPDYHFSSRKGAKISNAKNVGKTVGYIESCGYLSASLCGKRHLVHRIVWKMVYGTDAELSIDHIDQNRTNNAPSNLRLATKSENARNVSSARSSSKSGVLGVHFSQRLNKWRAEICINKKNIYLGLFNDLESAKEAYLEAKKKYHGEFSPVTGGENE